MLFIYLQRVEKHYSNHYFWVKPCRIWRPRCSPLFLLELGSTPGWTPLEFCVSCSKWRVWKRWVSEAPASPAVLGKTYQMRWSFLIPSHSVTAETVDAVFASAVSKISLFAPHPPQPLFQGVTTWKGCMMLSEDLGKQQAKKKDGWHPSKCYSRRRPLQGIR